MNNLATYEYHKNNLATHECHINNLAIYECHMNNLAAYECHINNLVYECQNTMMLCGRRSLAYARACKHVEHTGTKLQRKARRKEKKKRRIPWFTLINRKGCCNF